MLANSLCFVKSLISQLTARSTIKIFKVFKNLMSLHCTGRLLTVNFFLSLMPTKNALSLTSLPLCQFQFGAHEVFTRYTAINRQIHQKAVCGFYGHRRHLVLAQHSAQTAMILR